MRFGSVAGGGRYDGLVSRFRGEPVPATGFSIGVSRLTTALKNLGKLDTAAVLAPGRRAGHGQGHRKPRPLPADGRQPARGRHPRRNVSRRRRHEGADEICRPARQPLRRHPGRRRARGGRGPDQGSGRRRARPPKASPTTPNGAKAARRSSRWRRAGWSRPCARCSTRRRRSGVERGGAPPLPCRASSPSRGGSRPAFEAPASEWGDRHGLPTSGGRLAEAPAPAISPLEGEVAGQAARGVPSAKSRQ